MKWYKQPLFIVLGWFVIAVVFVVAASVFMMYEHNIPFSMINVRRADLDYVKAACFLFAEEHAGQFPHDWSGMLSYSNQAMFSISHKPSVKGCIFLCSSRWSGYRYIGGLSTGSPPDTVLTYSVRARQYGGVVLLASGHTESMSKAELEGALDRTYRWLAKPNHMAEPTRATSGAQGLP